MEPPTSPNNSGGLAKRSLSSLTWTAFASLATLPISFAQTILLARLLPVEFFGLFAGVNALVNLSFAPVEFGLSAALLHRAPETEDEQQAMNVYFTLRTLFTSAWAVALVVVALIAFIGIRRDILLVQIASSWMLRLAFSGHMLLVRRVEHRRLALFDMLQTVLVFLVAVPLAALTGSIWSLVPATAIQGGLSWMMMAVFRPVWRPRFTWDPPAMRYFLNFGSRTVVGNLLAHALDYLDDLWTNVFLGDAALGFYSRAYRFAMYPRIIVAEPIVGVTLGTYAELKGERRRLSQAFFRINALLVRSGFLLAGWLALIAPHFIVIFLGDKWLPMLTAFRLMLIYTLFDPIKLTVANVLTASGKPEQAAWVRAIQVLVLLTGLFLLGPRLGIAGVALAVDAMLLVGIVLMLGLARRFVDFSPWRMFAAPGLALAVGLAAGTLVGGLEFIAGSDWPALLVKSGVFAASYAAVLLAVERVEIVETMHWGLANLKR